MIIIIIKYQAMIESNDFIASANFPSDLKMTPLSRVTMAKLSNFSVG